MDNLVKLSGTCTQSGNDTQTSAAITTGISLQGAGFFGFKIEAVSFEWKDAAAVAAADWRVAAVLANSSAPASLYESDDDVISRSVWACQNTGGVAVAMVIDPRRLDIPFVDRITVQDNLHVICASENTAQANDIECVVYGRLITLKEGDWYRLRLEGI